MRIYKLFVICFFSLNVSARESGSHDDLYDQGSLTDFATRFTGKALTRVDEVGAMDDVSRTVRVLTDSKQCDLLITVDSYYGKYQVDKFRCRALPVDKRLRKKELDRLQGSVYTDIRPLRRVEALEARIKRLETELKHARKQVENMQ